MNSNTLANKKQIFVVSDSTGKTGNRVVKAVLSQFSRPEVSLSIWSYVRSLEMIQTVVNRAREHNGLIVYSIVKPEERREFAACAAEAGVTTIDLLGTMLEEFARFLDAEPRLEPGLFVDSLEENEGDSL